MKEFETLQFPDTPQGQRDKITELSQWTSSGWRVVGETLRQGDYEGSTACCLVSCCWPLVFLTPRKPGTMVVSLERDTSADPETIDPRSAPNHPALRAHRAVAEQLQQVAQSLNRIFLDTPSPDAPIQLPAASTEPKPEEPRFEELGLLGGLSAEHRRRIERRNDEADAAYKAAQAAWEERQQQARSARAQLREDLERGRFSNAEAMVRVLRRQLGAVAWPAATSIEAAALAPDGRDLLLEVLVPPENVVPAEWPQRDANGLSASRLSEPERRAIYAQVVHRIGLRVAGEAFRALPALETVTVSAFVHRLDGATGTARRDCLYSVQIPRAGWLGLNFADLGKIDVLACLDRFQPRKQLSSAYEFAPVEPLAAPPSSYLRSERIEPPSRAASEPSRSSSPVPEAPPSVPLRTGPRITAGGWLCLGALVLLPPLGMILVWFTPWRKQTKLYLCLGAALWWMILVVATHSGSLSLSDSSSVNTPGSTVGTGSASSGSSSSATASVDNWQQDNAAPSAMDDSPTVRYYLQAEDVAVGWLAVHRPTLVCEVREHASHVYVDMGMPSNVELHDYQTSLHTVRVRLDHGPQRRELWQESTDNTALFSPRPVALMRQLARADTLRISFTPFQSSPQVVTFAVSGFRNHIERLAEAGHWKQ